MPVASVAPVVVEDAPVVVEDAPVVVEYAPVVTDVALVEDVVVVDTTPINSDRPLRRKKT